MVNNSPQNTGFEGREWPWARHKSSDIHAPPGARALDQFLQGQVKDDAARKRC